jgi:uncharacterized membrane protein YkoI
MKNIRARGIAIGVVVLVGLILTTGCLFMDDEDSTLITMNELPAVVKPLAEKEIAGGKIKEVEKEIDDGKVIYAITYFDKDGTLMEIEYAEDGKLISKGKE